MNEGLEFTMFTRLQKKTILLVTSAVGRFVFGGGYWLLVTALCGCQLCQLHKDSRIMMGTIVEVISPDKSAANIAFDEIGRIENLLSKYNPDSEVSKLNKLGQLKVSPETFYIIRKAKEFYLLTDGAFDITVGPLIDLWGFTDKKYDLSRNSEDKVRDLPKKSEIKGISGLIGSDKILLNGLDNMIQFTLSGMKIDLGAIAKGYAVDCAIKKLKEVGIKSCLVNAGGDIYCLGSRCGLPWNIAIQNPRGRGFKEILKLKDKAVATSGDYEQYFIVSEKDKKRYSHILNPMTCYPADSGISSVTVIAQDCLTADALATSIFVLGKEKGMELVKKIPDVKVKIIQEDFSL